VRNQRQSLLGNPEEHDGVFPLCLAEPGGRQAQLTGLEHAAAVRDPPGECPIFAGRHKPSEGTEVRGHRLGGDGNPFGDLGSKPRAPCRSRPFGNSALNAGPLVALLLNDRRLLRLHARCCRCLQGVLHGLKCAGQRFGSSAGPASMAGQTLVRLRGVLGHIPFIEAQTPHAAIDLAACGVWPDHRGSQNDQVWRA